MSTIKQEKSLKNQIINHVAKYSLARAIKGLGQFINQYFAALLLGPSIFGIWQAVKMFLSYGESVGLGSLNGMHRQVPILRGRGKVETIPAIKNTSLIFNIGAGIALSFLLFLASFFLDLDKEIILGLRFVSLIFPIQFFKAFYETWLKANNQFDVISRAAVIEGIGFAVSVVLIFLFSFHGFLIGFTLTSLIGAVYVYLKSRSPVCWQWDFGILKKLIVIGFPIMLIAFSTALFRTVDRLLILKFLDTRSLGIYSLGWVAFLPVMFILHSANSVMYPRFTERFGRSEKESDLRNFIILPIKTIALLTPVLIGAIVVALPSLMRFFLPDYIEGIPAVQILLFGLFFSAVVGMAGNFLLATKRQYVYLAILLSSTLINLILSSIFLQLGLGIVGAAIGAATSYLIFFLSVIVIAMKSCKAEHREISKLVLQAFVPMMYVVFVSLLISRFINIDEQTFLGLVKNLVLKEVAFCASTSYLVYLSFKRLNIKETLKSYGKSRFLLFGK